MKKAKKSYTIHRSKKSQADKDLAASETLRKNLIELTYRVVSVATISGVEFICDSRSADLLSTRDTFKFIDKPMVWISAKAKHDRDYSLIEEYVEKKVKGIVVYGEPCEDMQQKLEGYVEKFISKPTLAEAIKAAFKIASNSDAVVYSPSCVVDDGFLTYVDRGKEFIRTVKELK